MSKIDKYVILTSQAKMPPFIGSYSYQNVAVIETDGERMPKQINTRHKAVVRIVRMWSACFSGKTERCEFRKALSAAESLRDRLMKEEAKRTD